MNFWTLEEGRWGDKCVQKNSSVSLGSLRSSQPGSRETHRARFLNLDTGHLGLDNSSSWGTILCIIGCLAASLADPSCDNPTYPQMLPSVS